MVRDPASRGALRAHVERTLFPKGLFYLNRLTFCRLSEARRPPRPLPYTSREACPEDEPLLQQVRPRRRGHGDMFEAGHRCFLTLHEGRGAGYVWMITGDRHVSEPARYTFALGPGAGWTYAVEIRPDLRLKGCFAQMWANTWDLIREAGINRIYTSMPEHENLVSFRSHGRLGFVPIVRYRVLRLLGTSSWKVEWPEGSVERGRGWWHGADPDAARIAAHAEEPEGADPRCGSGAA